MLRILQPIISISATSTANSALKFTLLLAKMGASLHSISEDVAVIHMTCPKCTELLSAPDEQAGRMMICPHCQQKLLVPVPADSNASTAPSSPQAAAASSEGASAKTKSKPLPSPDRPFNIKFKCIACGSPLVVAAEHADQMPMCDDCRHKLSSRGLPKPFCVRVSSEAVRWPLFCACCGNRAQATRRILHKKKVKISDATREDTLKWDLPYCYHCQEHVKLHQHANEALAAATEEYELASHKLQDVVSQRYSIPFGGLGWAIFWAVFVTLVGPGVLNPLLLQMVFGQTNWNALMTAWRGIWFVFGLVGLMLGSFLFFLSWMKMRESTARRLDKAERRAADAEEQLQKTKQFAGKTAVKVKTILNTNCTAEELAVHYVGWQGYTHVFYFDNEQYAVAFIALNREFVIEPTTL